MNNSSNNKRRNTQRQPQMRVSQGSSQMRPVKRLNTSKRPQGGQPPKQNRRKPSVSRRPIEGQQEGSRLNKVVAVWLAVLTVLLALILVLAFAGREDRDNTARPVVGTTEQTTEITTKAETYPVSYAEYTEDTLSFSSNLTFENGILLDIEKGTVLASRRGDERIYPASMTKIMTLIVATEAVDDLDETFTMTAEITDPLYLANASVAGFLVGEEVTVRDLIYGLILPSGGDGALGLAYHIAGSEEAFAELMNKKAAELGLTNTHFTNCSGLHDENHYSTCHEIALMLEYAINDEFMREVLSTYKYTTASTPEHPEGIELISTLLSRMSGDEAETVFVQGGKTGYTTEAKNCLASFATPLTPGLSEDQLKGKQTKYILVTAGSGEKFGPVFDAIEIYKTLNSDQPAVENSDAAAAVSVADTSAKIPKDTSSSTSTSTKTKETTPAETSVKTKAETTTESSEIKIYTAAVPE